VVYARLKKPRPKIPLAAVVEFGVRVEAEFYCVEELAGGLGGSSVSKMVLMSFTGEVSIVEF